MYIILKCGECKYELYFKFPSKLSITPQSKLKCPHCNDFCDDALFLRTTYKDITKFKDINEMLPK